MGSNIGRLVKTLNDLGIVTEKSWEGSIDEEKDPYPWIVINPYESSENAIKILFEGLADFNRNHDNQFAWSIVVVSANPDSFTCSSYRFILTPRNMNETNNVVLLERFWNDITYIIAVINNKSAVVPVKTN